MGIGLGRVCSLALSGALLVSCSARISGDAEPGTGIAGEAATDSSRYRRLTHAEWERTTRDLFGLAEVTGLSEDFRADPKQAGYLFASQGYALEVDQLLSSAYQQAASDLARTIATSPGELTRITGGVTQDGAGARQFIEAFGARAHRKPLGADQIDRYLALYEVGTTAYADQSGFAAGIRIVLEAMLQSPHFLYRGEGSTAANGGVIPLDAYERASRLSYFFWGTMPDAELFSAAASGALAEPAGVRTQAERLISDPRAAVVLVEFFDRVLDVERYESIAPGPAYFPDAPVELGEFALRETQTFVQKELYEKGGSLRDLLLSTTTYVNAELATIYGVAGTYGAEFTEAALDPVERAGVLTQVGFLASHATSRDPDPIHRGVFLARRVNCLPISAPPDMVPPLPDPNGKSNRQLVADHTEQGTCANCHQRIINPYGFTFEGYDAIGRVRTMDGTHPVDSTAAPLVDGQDVPVSGAVEMMARLAESTDVHECFATHLLEFAQGREEAPGDEALLVALGGASLGGASFRELMVEVAVAMSFLNRPLPSQPEAGAPSEAP